MKNQSKLNVALLFIIAGLLIVQYQDSKKTDLSALIKKTNSKEIQIDLPQIKKEKLEDLDKVSIKLNDHLFLEMENIQALSAEGASSEKMLRELEASKFIVIVDADTFRIGTSISPELSEGTTAGNRNVFVVVNDSTLLRNKWASFTSVKMQHRDTLPTGLVSITTTDGEILTIGNSSIPEANYINLEAAFLQKDSTNIVAFE